VMAAFARRSLAGALGTPVKRLVLLGTSHAIQRGESGRPSDLEARLEIVCRDFAVRALGEEMNREVLAKGNTPETVGERVARRLGLAHIYCDPTEAERMSMGTTTVPKIHAQAWRLDWSDEETARQLATHNDLVEGYWFGRIRELDLWPMLFMCGAEHVSSFSRRASQQGHEVVIADKDWGA
jgi:hypothetical protein